MLTVTFDASALLTSLNAATTRAVRSPAIMSTLHKRSMSRLTQRYLRILRVEPPTGNTFGITRLMTRKQARYVHALRGGMEGAFQRTHGISKGWQPKVQALNSSGEVSISNTVPGVNYVEGYDQQPFLKALGWPYVPPILDRFMQDAAAITRINWDTSSDLYAGVPI